MNDDADGTRSGFPAPPGPDDDFAPRARRRRRAPGGPPDAPDPSIDLTPMIDVTFQLIVFLLVANDLSRREIVDLDLPVSVVAVEDTPPADEVRVVVNLRSAADGSGGADVVFAGRRVDAVALHRALRTAADRSREGGPGSPSNVYALLRADRDLPWAEVQRVLAVCGERTVRIHRVQFAASRAPEPSSLAEPDGGRDGRPPGR